MGFDGGGCCEAPYPESHEGGGAPAACPDSDKRPVD